MGEPLRTDYSGTMKTTSALDVLVRTAKSGIYLVREIPRDLQRTARARAVRETTTLSSVLRQALHEYAAGTWTPRQGK